MEILDCAGKILKEKRLRNKKLGLIWKTTDIANALGINYKMINHYESGKRKIQFDLWWRWCNVLGITHRTVVERLEKELKGVEKQNAKDEVK